MMIEALVRRSKKEVNQKITPHSFRRSFATILHRSGYSMLIIKEKMGHKSIKTTQEYIKLNDSDLEKVMNPLDYVEKNIHPKRSLGNYQNKDVRITSISNLKIFKQMFKEIKDLKRKLKDRDNLIARYKRKVGRLR